MFVIPFNTKEDYGYITFNLKYFVQKLTSEKKLSQSSLFFQSFLQLFSYGRYSFFLPFDVIIRYVNSLNQRLFRIEKYSWIFL